MRIKMRYREVGVKTFFRRAEEEHRRLVREHIQKMGYPDPGCNWEKNPPFVIKLNKRRK